ncbi:iron-sulfur cluster assembly accessory protein [Paenalcaligenes niemegkensis]|uniref:HesB/IscA family protein n=1 Tax=Paenalcaligenes niemegkensis TaxID=2895469 RepID=UPI001EE9208C|nr:iron-sulfur cluster assembly accessory protein [Paenalcaligenes niemegkensis]MCQ9616582.1 iron-sulfur cluster assembly accessory protein [Paenalcaligenes niemegkensis]
MAISLTQQAAQHISRHLSKRGSGLGLRLGVRLTGCSGMAYKWDYVDQADANDKVFVEHGVTLFVDPKAMPFIDGTQIDYAREGLNEGFKFRNPNEAAACGCGESFTV